MTKTPFHQLPTNIRVACVPLWLGIVSIFFYSLSVKLSKINGEQLHNIEVLSVGLYISVFFLLKQKNKTTFIIAIATLSGTTLHNFVEIYYSYINPSRSLTALTVWWPLTHSIAFSISLIGMILPSSWTFYKA